MTVDRKFLDLFWRISGTDPKDRTTATNILITSLRAKPGDERVKYTQYTRERLVKGLRSFAEDARSGFYGALLALLSDASLAMSADELLELYEKHIYSVSVSTANEKNSLKHAYISSVDLLCESGLIANMKVDNVEKIVKPLLTLTSSSDWRSRVLDTLGRLSQKVSKKTVQKLLGQFIESVRSSLYSGGDENCGEDFLFLFRTETKSHSDHVAASLTTKKFQKKLVYSLLCSQPRVQLPLVDEIVGRDTFEEVWSRFCSNVFTEDVSLKRKVGALRIATHILCNYGDSLAPLVLTKSVVGLFQEQLTNKKFLFFSETCRLLEQILKTVFEQYKRDQTDLESAALANAEKCSVGMSNLTNTHRRSVSPDVLFNGLKVHSPAFDLTCQASAPRPFQFLLEFTPKAIQAKTLVSFYKKLKALFSRPSSKQLKEASENQHEVALPENPEVIRKLVANQLYHVLRCAIQTPSEAYISVVADCIDYLLSAALSGCFHTEKLRKYELEISTETSAVCWTSLFHLFDTMLSQPLRLMTGAASPIITPQTILQQTLTTALDKLELLQEGEDGNSHSVMLRYINQSIKLLTKADLSDPLDVYMSSLHATGCLFTMSQPSSEWSSIFNLLDDLTECWRRRHPKKDKIILSNGPAWPAVLTDVLLGFIAFPCHLLRSIVRLTFQRLVAGDLVQAECLKLISDVIRTRLAGKSNSRLDDEVDKEEDEEEETDELVTFNPEMQAHSGADDDEEGEHQEMVSDDDENPEDDEEVPNTSGDDSDESDIAEEVDEKELEKIREDVRKALGPAALDETEFDSTSCRRFTDEEMFTRDDALAKAFRANRKNAPTREAAGQARSLCGLKMRCLDLLACIVKSSTQPDILFPTIATLLEMLSEAYRSDAKRKSRLQKTGTQTHEKASFVARYGDLPSVSRISNVICDIRNRSSTTSNQFNSVLTDSNAAEKLCQIMNTVMVAAELDNPSADYLNSLVCVVQFVYRIAESLRVSHPNIVVRVSEPLLERLSLFLKDSRRSSVGSSVFLTLLKRSQNFAVHASTLLRQKVIDTTGVDESSVKELSSADKYTFTQCLKLMAAVFCSIASGSYTDDQLIEMPYQLLSKIIPQLNTLTEQSIKDAVWLASVSLTQAFFEFLTSAVRAVQNYPSVTPLTEGTLKILRNLPSPHKMIRNLARRFVTVVEEKSNKAGFSKDPEDRQEKLRLKAERKKARRAKRQEKALKMREKLSTSTETPRVVNSVQKRNKKTVSQIASSEPASKKQKFAKASKRTLLANDTV
ncbi:unnamed protein product [Calicophoron daubneyi]|uniref:Uncharacterized protein n=1 Tax=Calicophoron daubneyi TaxID=300641 RepID=A0AAV2TKS8_CALDB